MTIDEIKDYIKDYFAKHGYRTFEDCDTHSDAHSHYLDKTAIRYQYFGERMFDIYKKNLNNCLLRGDKWFLLEMVNPQKAMMTNNTHEALILDSDKQCKDVHVFSNFRATIGIVSPTLSN